MGEPMTPFQEDQKTIRKLRDEIERNNAAMAWADAEIERLRALNAELVKALTLAAHVIQEDLEDLPPRSDGKDIEAHDAARAALSKATESK
jgi:hypothetical protein